MKIKTNNLIYPTALTALFLLLLALPGCKKFFGIYDKERPDIISHELTGTEKAMLYYGQGDSVFFKDKNSGNTYYLYCSSKETGKDGVTHEDYHCENDGYKEVWDIITINFESNFPFSHNTEAKLFIHLNTTGQETSRLEIAFNNLFITNDNYNHFTYDVFFHDNKFRYVYYEDYYMQYDSLIINNKMYKDVSKIYYQNKFGTDQEIFYDTLYVNNGGLLRFVSSKYGSWVKLADYPISIYATFVIMPCYVHPDNIVMDACIPGITNGFPV